MVGVKTFVASIVVLLYVFLQHGIRAQSNTSSSFEDDFCSQMEEKWKIQVVENMHMQCALYSQLQTVENHRLKFELEKKQLKIEKLENKSISQADENHRLNMELEKKQLKIETLENESISQADDNHRLNIELEKKQLKIETLENESISRADENHRLNIELEKKQLKIETLTNLSISQSEEIQRLKLENERLRLRTPPVTATFISSFDHSQTHFGITKVENKIYVVNHDPARIRVYEDAIGFRFIRDIALNGTKYPWSIVYSDKSKCVYIHDYDGHYIWVMTTTGEHRLTKWLANVTDANTLSLSNEGHLLVLRNSQSLLDIYSLNSTLIRRLHLPEDVKLPNQVVQTSTGNFIVFHRLNAYYGELVISQLTNDGQLMNRFIPRNQSEELDYPSHLFLDSENNRLFVADSDNHRVVLFDADALIWRQVLLTRKMNGIFRPFRLFYDASKKHLFVAQHHANVTVYEIN